MRRIFCPLVWLVGTALCAAAEDPPIVGRVVDEQGQPVADVDVDLFWRGNGSGRDAQGKLLDFPHSEALRREFWGHEGEMAPGRDPVAGDVRRTGADGRFELAPDRSKLFTLVAMDATRTRGGRISVPKDYDGRDLEIRLGPLVRVHGQFKSPDSARPAGWTYADIFVPDEPDRPFGFTRLSGCGSFDSRFELLLPVGRYEMYANNSDPDWVLRLKPHIELELTADRLDVDLGTLALTEDRSFRVRERQAKKDGTLGDYRQHYGKSPPRWHAVDARGVDKDVELSAFRGKWVLLDFWGLNCSVCLQKTIPELIAFYAEHEADRDRFEILSICIDTDEEIDSMAELDRRLEPIVRYGWGGKKIPFPILLDNTFETWRNFGIPGLGVSLLVDPEGNLVEGDLATLAEKLKQ